MNKIMQFLKASLAKNSQLGGYVHDTAMSQFIPANVMHCITGTWTTIVGQVAGTLARHCAATDESTVVYVPVTIPSNSVAGKGSLLKSIELDYEVLIAACDSVTADLLKLTRGAEGAAATSDDTVAFTQSPAAGSSIQVDQHKLVVTLTTPAWVDNDEYYVLKVTFDKAASTTLDILGAVVNYTLRV